VIAALGALTYAYTTNLRGFKDIVDNVFVGIKEQTQIFAETR
jgi:hypothetical protein